MLNENATVSTNIIDLKRLRNVFMMVSACFTYFMFGQKRVDIKRSTEIAQPDITLSINIVFDKIIVTPFYKKKKTSFIWILTI